MLTLNSALFYNLLDLYQFLHKNDPHLSTYIQQMKGKIISLHPHFSHASRGQEAIPMQLSGNMICTIKLDQLLSYWQLFHLFISLFKMLCVVLFLFFSHWILLRWISIVHTKMDIGVCESNPCEPKSQTSGYSLTATLFYSWPCMLSVLISLMVTSGPQL